jgi:hypothetical protein
MKFSTFFDYQLWKIAVGVWNIKKNSLIAQKIGQTFMNSIKNNQLFIFNGSGDIHFLKKPCNPAFCEKDDIGQKRYHISVDKRGF